MATSKTDKPMVASIKDLLGEIERPDTVSEEELDSLLTRQAEALAQKLGQLEQARVGDIQLKTLNRNTHKKNVEDVQEAIAAAGTLLRNRFVDPLIKPLLIRVQWELEALKAFIEKDREEAPRGFPKAARLYLCVQIIATWKAITGDTAIPKRQISSNREPTGKFHEFLKSLLTAAGGHVANVNADELHRNMLHIADKMKRSADRADTPEVIDLPAISRGDDYEIDISELAAAQDADAAYRASIRDLNAWRGNPHSEPDTVADADSEAAAYRRSVRDLNAWRDKPHSDPGTVDDPETTDF